MQLRLIIPVIFLLIFAGCKQQPQQHFSQSTATDSELIYYPIYRVIDGDTFWLKDDDGKVEKIRLIGIDAPESRKSKYKEVEYFGKEAKYFLTDYLKNKKIALEFDVQKRDKYGRTLAYVYVDDGTFLNDFLVHSGYARAVTYQPNVKYQKQFTESERYARKYNMGMWAKR